jgi:ectoine hydroxylase-related dioxygenase (phytanoyl-CoA dioxygenase family)
MVKTQGICYRQKDVPSTASPAFEGAKVTVFPDGIGQEGNPFVVYIEEPMGKERPRFSHRADAFYHVTRGQITIEGEGIYCAGDVRWLPANTPAGPMRAGPDGAAFWIMSSADPTPIIARDAPENIDMGAPDFIPRMKRPYDWEAIEKIVYGPGAVILEGYIENDALDVLNRDFDDYLDRSPDHGLPSSTSDTYNSFQGSKTSRIHGVSEFSDAAAKLIADDEMVDSAIRMLSARADGVLLNAALVLQVNPGEKAQYIHSDNKSWPSIPSGGDPIVMNAIYALSDFSYENGGTQFALGSWSWDEGRNPKRQELVAAEMSPGDAVYFRADLLHGAGANRSNHPRRGLSVTYCAGWLRPVENSFLNISRERLSVLPEKLLPLLGYAVHDASRHSGGVIGLYRGGDPLQVLVK